MLGIVFERNVYKKLLKMDAHDNRFQLFLIQKKVRTRIYYDPGAVELIFNKPYKEDSNIMKKLHNSSLLKYDTSNPNKSTTSNANTTSNSNNSITSNVTNSKIQIMQVIIN